MVVAPQSRFQVACVVGFHISTALIVTLVNKAALNVLPVPVLLLLCQSITSLALILVGTSLGWYTLPKLQYGLIKDLSPILAMKVIAQLSKTYCLLNVNASFYQIARALLLPFTAALSFAFLPNSKPSNLALMACGITTIGFAWGLHGESIGQTSTVGIAWGVWSSLATAIETVVVKSLATKVGVLDLVYLTSLTTIPIYGALTMMTGDMAVLTTLGFGHLISLKFTKVLLISSVFNFALSVAAYLQITVTSPLTHMISTSTRGVFQSLLAVMFLQHERLSQSRIIGITVILFGTLTYVSSKEMDKRRQAASQAGLPFYDKSAIEEEKQGMLQEETTIGSGMQRA